MDGVVIKVGNTLFILPATVHKSVHVVHCFRGAMSSLPFTTKDEPKAFHNGVHGEDNAKGLKSNVPYVASVIAAYWIVSISMVYLNKVTFRENTCIEISYI